MPASNEETTPLTARPEGALTPTAIERPLPASVEVCGIPLGLTDYEDTLDWVDAKVAQRGREYVCVCNVHAVMASAEDPELRAALLGSSLNVPDGQPLVWALGALGHPLEDRVYGPELMSRSCTRSARSGQRLYLYGGRNQGALVQLALNLRQRYPGVKIVGGYSPPHRPLSDSERSAAVHEINASRADVVWVGIGVPKQEKWMAQMRGELDAPVLIGVGAAFDFHAGLVPQAPPWMQELGLEWSYRLAHEPRRLWRRYTRYNPRFVRNFGRQFVAHRRAMRRTGKRATRWPPPETTTKRCTWPRARAATPAGAVLPAGAGRIDGVSGQPTASIVIPTRNRPEYLDVALASVMPQAEAAGADVLVVDSGTAAATQSVAERHGARVVRPNAPGANAARNAGIAVAEGDPIVLIDDDIDAPPGWLEAMLSGVERTPDRDVFGGPIRARLEGGGPRACGRESAPITTLDRGATDRDVELVWSANMAIRRRALELVGPFDESIHGRGEEEDWQRRYAVGGGRVRYLAAAGLDHRRNRADATVRRLSGAAYRLGRTARRYDALTDRAPALTTEVRTLAGCVWHTGRRRCATGIVLTAHAAGRLREALAGPSS